MVILNNLNSSAINEIKVDEETDVVSINYTSNDKFYDYTLNGVNRDDFITNVNNLKENGGSVGTTINKMIREDQTLQLIAQ